MLDDMNVVRHRQPLAGARLLLGLQCGPTAGGGPPSQVPTCELDSACDREGYRERQQQPLPGCDLERAPAKVAEQGGIACPAKRRSDVEEREPAPWKAQRARAKRDGSPAAGDEAGNDDQLPSAFAELLLGPTDALLGLGAAEEALPRSWAIAMAEEIRGVVARKSAARSCDDDQREAEIATCSHHPCRNHHRLARHHRHDRVENSDEEDDPVRPP